jgi:glutathione synthase/RimK-type ligase-like ATP-grasp enzyme
MKIAIHFNKKKFDHSTSWNYPYIKYCEQNGIEYEIVDCFQSDIMQKLINFDVLLWHGGSNYSEALFFRSILYSAKQMGLKVFPDLNDVWHFDDKVSETYLLQSISAPIPKTFIFHLYDDVKRWVKGDVELPVVAKLKAGSGSNNVKLLKSKRAVLKYARRMFGRGYDASPNIFFKAKSNFNSSKGDRNIILARMKRIPEFLRRRKNLKAFPREKGYVFLQQFIQNDGYDLKIVVVGDKLTFCNRPVRDNDFRASGGGSVEYDKSLVTKQIIDTAFEVSDKLGFKCMGYDFVVNNNNDKGVIIEMSYGFSWSALFAAGGYFDRAGNWHNEPMNAPEEIIKNMINNE